MRMCLGLEDYRKSAAEREPRPRSVANSRCLMALQGRVAEVAAQGVFNLILQPEFAFLERDFFDLFGSAEEGLTGEMPDALVEVVMLGDQLPECRVVLQQLVFQL